MAEPETIPLTPPGPARRPTIPPGGLNPTNGWDVAQTGLSEAGAAWRQHQERAPHRQARTPRPPASTLSIATAVAVVFLMVGAVAAVLVHEIRSDEYEARQLERHEALMDALKLQQAVLWALIDTISPHHPDAEKAGRLLQRGFP